MKMQARLRKLERNVRWLLINAASNKKKTLKLESRLRLLQERRD